MEVLWKAESQMINQRITMETKYHKVHHVFRVGRGMDTASLESKLFQHITLIRYEVLYYVFLKSRKLYDAMDVSGDCIYRGGMV